MQVLTLTKSGLLLIALLANLGHGQIGIAADQSQEPPLTCEAAMNELSRFNKPMTTWGSTNEGDPQTSMQMSSDAGETFWLGTTVYRSKSRFKKNARALIEDKQLVQNAPLVDEKGREIGQRVVKESRTEGNVTTVRIFRITDRMINGISAPSLKLALAVEKAHITCRGQNGER